MAIYKVSFVVTGREHPGAIVNWDHQPEIGEKVTLGTDTFEVIEVMELMPLGVSFIISMQPSNSHVIKQCRESKPQRLNKQKGHPIFLAGMPFLFDNSLADFRLDQTKCSIAPLVKDTDCVGIHVIKHKEVFVSQ